MSKNVLFVCTGNTCRSPAAAALFNSRLADPQTWWIESAGIRSARGAPVSTELLNLLAARGIDLLHHRSKPLEDLPLDQFDLILVMEEEHKQAVEVRFPNLAGRVFLISEMSGGHEELADPFGAGQSAYQVMLQDLERLLDLGLAGIITRAKGQ
jgi:protein-tyrosine-phosphatase